MANFPDRFATRVQMALGICLMIAVVLNFANVVARYVFNTALFGIEEVQVYLIVAVAFLGTPVVMFRKDHLRMDALSYRFPRPIRRGLTRLELLTIVALCGFTAYQSYLYTSQMLSLDRKSDLMGIPMWIPHGAVALGLTVTALIALRRLFKPVELDPGADSAGDAQQAQGSTHSATAEERA